MSTGTNKERIEQNNIKLEEIKGKIDKLPEYQDFKKIYATVDLGNGVKTNLKDATVSKYIMTKHWMLIPSSNVQWDIYYNDTLVKSVNPSSISSEIYTSYIFPLYCTTTKLVFMTVSRTRSDTICITEYDRLNDTITYIGRKTLRTTLFNSVSQSTESEPIGSGGFIFASGSFRFDDETNTAFSHHYDSSVLPTLYALKYNPNTTEVICRGIGSSYVPVSHNMCISNSGTITKFIYDEFDMSTISKRVGNDVNIVNGVNYLGNKVFLYGNVYQLNEDLSLGSLLKENAYVPDKYSIECINDLYYRYKNVLYRFDEETNTFTSIDTNYFFNGSSLYKSKADGFIYRFDENYGDKWVGVVIEGVFIPVDQSSSISSEYIVQGYSAYTETHQLMTGTMQNNGELNYTPSTEEQVIPSGYTSGGTIAGDSNLVANNIRLGTTIFGVEGNLEADKPDQTKTATPTTEEQVITPDTGYELASVTVEAVTSDIDSNIVAENIKKDVSILGVTGTLESGGSSDYNAKLVPINGRITAYITKISESLDTSSVTSMTSMFQNCTNLTTIPLLNTSNVTDMSYMFSNCSKLTTIPLLDIRNVTTMNSMFTSCTNLTTIPVLNTSKVTDMTGMFRNCTNLSDESLNNILAMCINATSYTKTKSLDYIGLSEEQATKCTTLSNYSAFRNAGWTRE